MRLRVACLALVGAISMPMAQAKTPDPVIVAYMQLLMNEKGFAQKEFARFGDQNPHLMAYFIGVATSNRCSHSMPSERLAKFVRAEEAAKTQDGMKAFATAMVLGTSTFPDESAQRAACVKAQDFLAKAEAEAAK